MLCAAIGSVMATEAVKLIAGIGEPLLGLLLIYDALALSHQTIDIRKDPAAPPITGLVDYEAFCGTADPGPDPGVTPSELRDLLAAGAPITLIDVREPAEWEIGHLEGAVLVPASAIDSGLAGLPPGRTPVLYCRTGVRSASVLAAVRAAGFPDATHLQGGIVAWARQFDSGLAIY